MSFIVTTTGVALGRGVGGAAVAVGAARVGGGVLGTAEVVAIGTVVDGTADEPGGVGPEGVLPLGAAADAGADATAGGMLEPTSPRGEAPADPPEQPPTTRHATTIAPSSALGPRPRRCALLRLIGRPTLAPCGPGPRRAPTCQHQMPSAVTLRMVGDCDAVANPRSAPCGRSVQVTVTVAVALCVSEPLVPVTVNVRVPRGVRVVTIVRVEDPEPVTVGGRNDAVQRPGRPLTLRDTVPLKPD